MRMKTEPAGRFMFENWSYCSNSMCDWTPHIHNPVKTHSSGKGLCMYKAAGRAGMPGCRSTHLLDRWRSSPVKDRKLSTFLPAHLWLPGKRSSIWPQLNIIWRALVQRTEHLRQGKAMDALLVLNAKPRSIQTCLKSVLSYYFKAPTRA